MSSKPSLIVFADDWGRHPSSCQHLVRRLQDRWRILWVNTVGTRTVRVDVFTFRRGCEKLRSWSAGLRQVADDMWVLDPPMLPTGGGRLARIVNRQLVTSQIRSVMRRFGMSAPLVLSTLPYTVWLLGEVGQRGLVYNCTDDYSHWPTADRPTLQRAEAAMRQRANLILAASRQLQDLHRQAVRCEYFPHAVDYDHFAAARAVSELPQALQAIPRPRVGFFGLIYEKLDFRLLTEVVAKLPQVHLVLIGPRDYCPSEFAALPRVHLIDRQPYEDLPRWIAGLDVLLLPYVSDAMILQSNPLKLRECLATGKPTVSIDIPEVRNLAPHVDIARDTDEFVEAVARSLTAADEGRSAARQQAVRNDNWDVRAGQLQDYLLSLSAAPSGA